MKKFSQLFLLILLCELVGLSSLPLSLSAIPTWYVTLTKPFFAPPNWVFGPVWIILYGLMGAGLFFVITKKAKKETKHVAVRFFGVQLLFNFLWSALFFGAHAPLLAFFDLLALLVAIGFTMYFFHKLSVPAFFLLVPYFLWVCFAGILNLSIVLLNK